MNKSVKCKNLGKSQRVKTPAFEQIYVMLRE